MIRGPTGFDRAQAVGVVKLQLLIVFAARHRVEDLADRLRLSGVGERARQLAAQALVFRGELADQQVRNLFPQSGADTGRSL